MVLSESGEEASPFGFLLDLRKYRTIDITDSTDMMVTCSGKERTLQDYSKLFDASGWKLVTMHKTPAPLQLIEAVRL